MASFFGVHIMEGDRGNGTTPDTCWCVGCATNGEIRLADSIIRCESDSVVQLLCLVICYQLREPHLSTFFSSDLPFSIAAHSLEIFLFL